MACSSLSPLYAPCFLQLFIVLKLHLFSPHFHTPKHILSKKSIQLPPRLFSESMDNGWQGHNYQWGGLRIALRDENYQEMEVWEVLDDGGGRAPAFYYEDEPKGVTLKNHASDVRGIPWPEPGSGGSLRVQKSAPVNISYWPKKSNSGGASSTSGKKKDPRDNSEDEEDKKGESEDEEEEDVGRDTMLPPHEYIARRLERSHISTFSVLEGVGRKLKGRDLTKVRNAVLTKTGFLESP